MSSDKVLIFNLDETLIYASYELLPQGSNYIRIDDYYIYIRPHLEESLAKLAEVYKIGIWTASSDKYALPIIKALIKVPLVLIFTGEKCVRGHKTMTDYDVGFLTQYVCFKPLKKVKKRLKIPLSHMLAIDNTAQTYKRNYGNGVLVPDFKGYNGDEILLHLTTFLLKISDREDLRQVPKSLMNWLPTARLSLAPEEPISQSH